MSLTRDQLAERVRRMLYDFATPASATMTGDGVTNIWILPDRYIDSSTLKLYLTPSGGGVNEITGSTLYSFDPDSSAVTFTSAPDVDTTGDATYWYNHWAEEDIIWALSDAIYALGSDFYKQTVLSVTADGSTKYELEDPSGEPVMRVREVTYSSDGTNWERLSPNRQYRIERGDLDAATLVLFTAESSGTLQVSCTVRPRPFASGDETLAELGLPERCQRALVLFASWTLIEQRIIPRMRSDIAVVTQGEGVPTPYMLLQHSARIKALLDTELERQHMRPQMAVGI